MTPLESEMAAPPVFQTADIRLTDQGVYSVVSLWRVSLPSGF